MESLCKWYDKKVSLSACGPISAFAGAWCLDASYLFLAGALMVPAAMLIARAIYNLVKGG